jgi:hypothetical protein
LKQEDKENYDQNKPIKSILKKNIYESISSLKTNEIDETLSHYNQKSILLDNESTVD